MPIKKQIQKSKSIKRSFKNKASSAAGFTLIELLVVISIIGLLASIVLAAVDSARANAVQAQTTQNAQALNQAINLYYDDHGTYPDFHGCGLPSDSAWAPFTTAIQPYLGSVHQDDSRNVFYCYNNGEGTAGYQSYFAIGRPEDGGQIAGCDWSGTNGYMFLISGASPSAYHSDGGGLARYYEFFGGDGKGGHLNSNSQNFPYDYCQ